MDIQEARRIWGPDMPEDVLKEWVRAVNKRRLDDPKIPKGATIEIDEKTGKVVPRTDY
jgi:hypothetical protein